MKFKLAILTAIIILSSNIFGHFGLDNTFSDDGFFNANPHDGGNGWALTSAIERLPDGKYLVVGSAVGLSGGSNLSMTIQKINADGTIDTSFGGGDGVWAIAPNGFNAEARGIAVQPDGKIIVAGLTRITVPGNTPTARETVVRLNPDGTLDNTFASDGMFIQAHAGGPLRDTGTEAFDVELLANGNIVTSGQHSVRNNSAPGDPCGNNEGLAAKCSTIAIYSPNGAEIIREYFDFGIGTDLEFLGDIEIQDDGSIIGVISNQTDINDFAIVKFASNGFVDLSFGVNGVARTSNFFGQTDLRARNVEIQTDGKLLVTGYTNGLITARFNSDGTLDSSYGVGGKTESIVSGSSAHRSGEATIILPSGKILTNDGADRLIRLNADGSRDSSFGSNGVLQIIPLLSVGQISDMVLQPDGKIAYTSRTTLLGPGQGPVDTWLVGRLRPTNGKFDFDGDSRTDVSIFRPNVGEWWYSRSSDGGNNAFQFGTSSDKLVPADYTGDGKTDVAFWRESTGQWFILRSEDSSFYGFPFGASGDIPAPGDFDGDGSDDAAVFRPSNSTWYIQRSSDGGTTIQGFGTPEDKPTVADYDGDGKDDIAIFRPSVSQWWQLRSQDGLIAYDFGLNGDFPVQGDYTGDGKADVTVWRPSNGNWLVLRSEDSSFYSFPFGNANDIPSPGDYDGDGTFDAAVFRPSNNVWYINGSSSGTQIIGFGIDDDIPIPNVFVP